MATISILANTFRPPVHCRLDDTAFWALARPSAVLESRSWWGHDWKIYLVTCCGNIFAPFVCLFGWSHKWCDISISAPAIALKKLSSSRKSQSGHAEKPLADHMQPAEGFFSMTTSSVFQFKTGLKRIWSMIATQCYLKQDWSNLNQFVPIWSNLNQFEPICTNFIQFEPI